MNQSSNLRSNAHAVIIGINEYQDEKIPDLQFARADAEGVYQILTDPELGRIPPENVILLLDEQATQQNIRSAIGDEIPRRAGEDDFVYIYFAGHGMPFMNPKNGSADGMEKYLVPVDAKLDKIRGTGIPMDDIQRFFGYIQSKQVMFFIDSCFSGEAGGRTFQNPAYQTRHGLLTPEFLDQLSGEGRLVVTACDVNELSIETSAMGHGLFTHYLMEGLKGRADKDQDGLVTIHELYDYVYDHVSQHARKLGGSMRPILKGSIKGKIPLTLYETPTQKQAKSLDDQAQALFKAGKFGEAYELWHQVIELVPDHSGAEQGLAEVENWLKEKERKRQEILERKQRLLLQLNREGQLPSDEFDLAMTLIEKNTADLTALERETRRLLDELTNKKISAASYVKSVRLLRKPVEPEPALVSPKSESEKIPEAKQAASKPEPQVVKAEMEAPQQQTASEPIVSKLLVLRKTPATLSKQQVKGMLKEYGFYCAKSLVFWNYAWSNPQGKGITHNYMEQTLNGNKVILDKTTGLMWQQSGSPNFMIYSDAEKDIRELNNKPFAGFTNWRLPTLEEAMSLMETQTKNGALYIDSKFDQTQEQIWTADKSSAGAAWVAYFSSGNCLNNFVAFNNYVRAVR